MDIRRIDSIKQGDAIIGNRTRIKVTKNKVAPPFKQAEFDIMYGSGISKVGDMLDLAANNGIVEKAGAWYAYNNNKLGQGRENSKAHLEQNPELTEEIKQKILVKFGLVEGATPAINETTGEIIEEEKTKKSKKVIQ